MKKFLILLNIIIIFCVSVVFAETITIPDNNYGSGGGSSGGVNISGTVISPVSYTVKGTVYLPEGMSAPKGGIKIYGGFGGVTLNDISTASLLSENSYTEESVDTQYELCEVIAEIPEGRNYASYSAECTIKGLHDGIYGKFWVYDDITSSGVTLSNKEVVSNIVTIKANVTEYSGMNCVLGAADESASFSVYCDSELSAEAIATPVYVIADDGYDRYVTKTTYSSANGFAHGSINLENGGDYQLYYYIPDSILMNLQKLDKGLFNVGALSDTNVIYLKAQNYLSGKIMLPDGREAEEDIEISIQTQESYVNVVIPKGEASAEYIIGVMPKAYSDYMYIDINDDHLVSGYCLEGDSFFENKKTWQMQDRQELDITLEEQYLIKGKITLPEDITMEENTFFRVRIFAEGDMHVYDESVYVFSDTGEAEYKITVPKSASEGTFTISYCYDTYQRVSYPTSAESPLKVIGTASGGGGSAGSGVVDTLKKDGISYAKKIPDALIQNCRFYLRGNGVRLFEDQASKYSFAGGDVQNDITLIQNSDNVGVISGFFQNAINSDMYTMVRIDLFDKDGKLIDIRWINDGEGYYFEDLPINDYKIGVWYEDKQYYYNNKKLAESIDDAEIISLGDKGVSLHNDIYYENIYDTNMYIRFEDIVIDGEYYGAIESRIYDKFGTQRGSGYSGVSAKVSPFYIGIGDYYVSGFEPASDGTPYVITELTSDIEKAYLIDAEYYNSIDEAFYKKANNTFCVNATTDKEPKANTKTVYAVSGDKLTFNIEVQNPVSGDTIFVAAYSPEGRLINLASVSCGQQSEYSLSMNCAEDMKKIKIMIWSGLEKIQSPRGPSEEITVISETEYQNNLKNIANAYFVLGNTAAYYEGKEVKLSSAPIKLNNELYVPARALGEAMECTVSWYAETETVFFGKGNIGYYAKPSVPEYTQDGDIFVDCMNIAMHFGYEVYAENDVVAIFDEVKRRNKYAYDNGILDSAKLDISALSKGITRQEMASLIVNLYEKTTGNKIVPAENVFWDTENEDILKAYALDVMLGYEDNTFKPQLEMMYSEVVTVVYRTVRKIDEFLEDKYDEVPDYENVPESSNSWVVEYLYGCKRLGILDGVCYDEIAIYETASRADSVAIIANAYRRLIGAN